MKGLIASMKLRSVPLHYYIKDLFFLNPKMMMIWKMTFLQHCKPITTILQLRMRRLRLGNRGASIPSQHINYNKRVVLKKQSQALV
jgi:hypothetical protein